MRLGADPVKVHAGTAAHEIYGEAVIYERHRHRYEVSISLRKRLESAGLVVSGTSPDERLVEMIELHDHPFFVASQFHPEFKSRPERPAPLFREFVKAALGPRRRGAPGGRGPRVAGRAGGRRGAVSDAAAPPRATEAERARLNDALRRAVRDPVAVRRRRRRVRARVVALLERRGLRVRAVDAAGNTLARRGGAAAARAPSVLLCAHLDTVPHDGIADRAGARRRRLGERQRRDPRRRQQGGGRGAAGRRRADRATRDGPARTSSCCFTVEEETALAGAKQLRRLARCAAPFGYVYDHATPIGEIVVASPTYYRFEAELRGRAAHAGIRPEDGRNAIVAAARAIASMRLGRVDDRDDGEHRAHRGRPGRRHQRRRRPLRRPRPRRARWTPTRSRRSSPRWSTAATTRPTSPSASATSTSIVERLFEGYRHKPTLAGDRRRRARAGARAATRRAHIVSGGAADANAFAGQRLPHRLPGQRHRAQLTSRPSA